MAKKYDKSRLPNEIADSKNLKVTTLEKQTKELVEKNTSTSPSEIMLLGFRAFSFNEENDASDLLEQKERIEIIKKILLETQEGSKQTTINISDNTKLLSAILGKKLYSKAKQELDKGRMRVFLDQINLVLEDSLQAFTSLPKEIIIDIDRIAASVIVLSKSYLKKVINSQKIK